MRKVVVLLLCLLSIDQNERHLWLVFDTLGKSLLILKQSSHSHSRRYESSTDASLTCTVYGALFTATRTATYDWNARGYSSSYTNVSQGDATAVVLPDVTPGNGLVQVQPGRRVSGTIFDVTVAVLVTQLPHSPALPNGQPALGPLLDGSNVGQPPVPSGALPVKWFGVQGVSTIYSPWQFLSPALSNFKDGVPSQAYREALSRKTVGGAGTDMLATEIWQGYIGAPAGTEVEWNFGAWVGAGVDFAAGVLDAIVGQWARQFIFTVTGLGWVQDFVGLDSASEAYAVGQYVGQVVRIATEIALIVAPGSALARVGQVLSFAQAGNTAVEAAQAFRSGNYIQGVGNTLLVGLFVSRGLGWSPCGAKEFFGTVFGQAAGNTAGAIAGAAASWGLRGLAAYSAGTNFQHAVTQFGNGDIIGGLLSAVQGGVDLFSAGRACFTADTKIMARGAWGRGWRRIDQVRAGDEVLSRDENDPNGPLVWKLVQETFQRWAFVHELQLGGQVIGTTLEHPFYAINRGWTPAGGLAVGDRIAGMDLREDVAVADVKQTGTWAKVYNCRVADYHTYFVGSEEWGFSVWAHNAYQPTGAKRWGNAGNPKTRAHMEAVAKELKSRGWTITGGGQSGLREEWIPGPIPGSRRGGTSVDVTATKNGRTLRIQTIDTLADGVTPTPREARNAARIRAAFPSDHLLLVPKPK